jgi:hypothetical protein
MLNPRRYFFETFLSFCVVCFCTLAETPRVFSYHC